MRPPDLPGGNAAEKAKAQAFLQASMRPPDLSGGNVADDVLTVRLGRTGFNEVAGFIRRKPTQP